MMTLVCFLEERSAEEMLKGILPKILPDCVVPRYVVFEGKQHLEKLLVRRMRLWKVPNSMFIVIRDQDSGDCRVIKQGLLCKCHEANQPNAVVRIACHELESFYIGDLKAVEKGLKIKGLSNFQNKRKFRDPDNLMNPAKELMKLTGNSYQKISGSRAIGRHLDLENNLSNSFDVLVNSIIKLTQINCDKMQ